MKTKTTLFYFVLLLTININAQWSITDPTWTNSNTGIGTENPNGRLHIIGTGSQDLLLQNAGIGFSSSESKWADLILARWERSFLDLTNWGSGADAEATVFRISANHSMGKESTLSLVRGSGNNIEFVDFYNNGYSDATNFGIRIQKRGTGAFRDFVFDQSDGASYTPIMILKNTGNVGIGTNTPSESYKLDVAGSIRATEIKVEDISANNTNLTGTLSADQITINTNGNTADFVFEDDYQLPTLSEVESFITTNKHLPDVPSAASMEEEGVNLAEMNKLLLQKVEELMLYAIEQEKRIRQLEAK